MVYSRLIHHPGQVALLEFQKSAPNHIHCWVTRVMTTAAAISKKSMCCIQGQCTVGKLFKHWWMDCALFRINEKTDSWIIQESHQFSKTDFRLERVVGLPRGCIPSALCLGVGGGEAVSACLQVSFLTQLRINILDLCGCFIKSNASKHLQVHLESKNSVGAKSRESMTQTSYGIYIYLEK